MLPLLIYLTKCLHSFIWNVSRLFLLNIVRCIALILFWNLIQIFFSDLWVTLHRKLSRRTTHILSPENAIKIVSGNPDHKDIKFWSQWYKWGWGSTSLPEEHIVCKEAPSDGWEGDEIYQYQSNKFTSFDCQGLQRPGKPNPRSPGSYNCINLLTLSKFPRDSCSV